VQGKRLEFIICLDSAARMRLLCARETLGIYKLLGFRSEDANCVCKGSAWNLQICLDSTARMRIVCARETLEIYNLLGFRSEDANFVCEGNA
jgi:hypothetical protein